MVGVKADTASQTLISTPSPAELDAYWMPFTGNRQFKAEPRIITAAHGCHYYDADGQAILDSLSGLWCASFGHGRTAIADSIAETVRELDYAPPFQFGHPAQFKLAKRVVDLTPAGLDHAFFTNSGSESADTALKMARAYWQKRGADTKTRLIGRAKGYHGVNIGGTSVGGIEANRADLGGLWPADHLSHTLVDENRFSRGIPESGAERADELEALIATHGADNIAAVMVEPVAGSAGVIVPPAGYLQRLRAICDRHDVLLIFDEVLTGFGRTGASFGAELFGVRPDMMTLAKNMTNGTVPMGAVVVSDAIYRTFMEQDLPHYQIEFAHGYTYSGHPLACAAGLAALDLYENEQMVAKSAALAPYFEEQIHRLRGLPHVSDIRNIGLAGALEIETVDGEPSKRPWKLSMGAWQRGMYLRYGGNTVQLGPPLISEREHIDQMCNVLEDVLLAID
ncbi:aminotransferase class III-fold pyridoxal phosphate-dependent enzyme [Salinisphaera sp. USBA-960]|uniref:aminotransferase class III-fold pyridoxal phosphate-dependent enzyme n=1 Tax=Salinisphaera orenii TaxID=856731 RepID=UPI000DBE0FBD|nr:aminotransferase class III-fold pyridoxal phosphate-dependent enzyme [Salifodinibacter halophilus]NNC26032.1 aminotransferase class III-fold pyridoxal phosphate-dependent enzyme [Salifodinibacter halophilus]